MLKIIIKSIVTIIFIILNISSAIAYDDQNTHPQLTTVAVSRSSLNDYLNKNLGFNAGSLSIVNGSPIIKNIRTGSTEEDSPNCRAASHFLNPLKPWNEAGVSDTNETLLGFSIINPLCFATAPFSSRFTIHKYSDVTWATGYTFPAQQGGATGNDMDWNAARTYYRLALTATDNATREAYFAQTFQALGQVIHLLQDMAVPAHVRNDFTVQRFLEELS